VSTQRISDRKADSPEQRILVTTVRIKYAVIQASTTLNVSTPTRKFAMRLRVMQATTTKSNTLDMWTSIVDLIIIPEYATTRRIAGATTTKRLLYTLYTCQIFKNESIDQKNGAEGVSYTPS
jgi:hypothetical protein